MHPSLKELRADKKLPTSTTQKAKEEKNDRKAKNNESVGTNKNKSKIIQLNETQLRKNDVNDEKKRQQSG
ncbi:hypothetical protein DICVIV_14279 [Dictyocaulus viviparus]|nr:hypothetical protein DICVIV_14279 [Dictyocaulus viviparus]